MGKESTFSHLVRNSIDALRDCETRTVSATTVPRGNMVEVVANDSGSGLSEEV